MLSTSTHPIELESLAAPFIRMSEEEAARAAQRHFGLTGPLTRFSTEKDDTFRLDSQDGKRFILKIANPAEDPLELDLQVEVLRHIARTAPALPVPRVVESTSSTACPTMEDAAGQLRQLRVLTYLAGTPLDSTESSPTEREAVGEILAKLRRSMEGFSHAGAQRTVPWDVKNLPRVAHLLSDVENARHRTMLAEGLDRLAPLHTRISRLRRQVLHNDFSRSNIVVDHDFPGFVTGIIDFGDTVHTAIAIEVSTAILNQLPRNTGKLPDEDMFAAGRDILRGYLRHAELTDEELLLIPHLVMARVITRALLSTGFARRFPANATYLLRNTEQGWAQLDWFLRHSPGEISAAISSAYTA